MKALSAQQILFIHARLIAETGGAHGIRDLGMLEAAAARPFATFDGTDLYPDIFAKAAALFQSLSGNHPFLDGNKRTAISATAIFFQINGYRLRATNEEIVTFVLKSTTGEISFDQTRNWLQENTVEEHK